VDAALADMVVYIKSTSDWERAMQDKNPTMVMFTSKFCGACQHIKAKLPMVKKELPAEVTFALVDLDEADKAIITSALGQIAFVPAFQVYCGGSRLHYFIASDEDTLRGKLSEVHLDKRRCVRVGYSCFRGLYSAWCRLFASPFPQKAT